MRSKDITVTDARFSQAVEKAISRVAVPQIKSEVNEKMEQALVRTGVITKFYHYLDKAEVKLDNSNEKVLCKILHRFGGELIDYFTPTADDVTYCDDRHEPCVIPRGQLHVCVLNIHDSDSDEHLILGFYSNEELLEVNPAAPGNFKIVTRGGTNQWWIKFGYDGLDLRLNGAVTTKTGSMDSEMVDVDYADSSSVYTKDEVYTKEEVDELIKKAIQEALGEENDTTD